MFTGKQFAGTTKSGGDSSSAISKIPSRSQISGGFVLTIPGWYMRTACARQSVQRSPPRFHDDAPPSGGQSQPYHMFIPFTIHAALRAGATSFLADSLSTGCALSCPDPTPHRAKGIAMITIAEGRKRWRASPLACQYCNASPSPLPPLRSRSPREKRIQRLRRHCHQFGIARWRAHG